MKKTYILIIIIILTALLALYAVTRTKDSSTEEIPTEFAELEDKINEYNESSGDHLLDEEFIGPEDPDVGFPDNSRRTPLTTNDDNEN